jgi:hypothetical protein
MDCAVVVESSLLIKGMIEGGTFGYGATLKQIIVASYSMG